jgi:CDGSH-type Zn-finger protein
VQIVDSAGKVLQRTRQTLALCRCGKSRLAPLCDGTHKLGATRARVDPAIEDDMPKPDQT